MSAEEREMHNNRATETDRKRHYSSDADSSDTPIIARHDWTPPFDTTQPHDNVAPSSEGAVKKHTKAALMKKLRDSTKQHHVEQGMNSEVMSSGAGKIKVSKQEPLVSPLVARRHHKPALPPTQSSLLEDVLNEKKLALLQSPEVRAFLEHAQRSVAEEKRHDNAPEGATHPDTLEECIAVSAGDMLLLLRRDDYLTASETRDDWANTRTTNVAGADIWSKEASAFTSVVRPTQQ